MEILLSHILVLEGQLPWHQMCAAAALCWTRHEQPQKRPRPMLPDYRFRPAGVGARRGVL